jgi:hypothetical protein
VQDPRGGTSPRLAEDEQKARQAEQLATALKEKCDKLVTVEGHLQEERTAREHAETQLQLERAALERARSTL